MGIRLLYETKCTVVAVEGFWAAKAEKITTGVKQNQNGTNYVPYNCMCSSNIYGKLKLRQKPMINNFSIDSVISLK